MVALAGITHSDQQQLGRSSKLAQIAEYACGTAFGARCQSRADRLVLSGWLGGWQVGVRRLCRGRMGLAGV
jgi:hypothetical protein